MVCWISTIKIPCINVAQIQDRISRSGNETWKRPMKWFLKTRKGNISSNQLCFNKFSFPDTFYLQSRRKKLEARTLERHLPYKAGAMPQALPPHSVTSHWPCPTLTHPWWRWQATDNTLKESQVSSTELSPRKLTFLPRVFWVPFHLSPPRTRPFGYPLSCPLPNLPSLFNHPDQRLPMSLNVILKTKTCHLDYIPIPFSVTGPFAFCLRYTAPAVRFLIPHSLLNQYQYTDLCRCPPQIHLTITCRLHFNKRHHYPAKCLNQKPWWFQSPLTAFHI